MDTWTMLAWERRRLAADLADIDAAAWSMPTACGEWNVRQVVGHVSGLPSPISSVIGLLRRFGNVDAFIDDVARKRALAEPAELLNDLREFADSRRLPPGTTVATQLSEIIVHGNDIRSAVHLDEPGDRPHEHAETALDWAVRSGPLFGGRRRSKGLHLEATDIAWSHGAGPTVAGTGVDLLCGLLGRDKASVLDGTGVKLFAERS